MVQSLELPGHLVKKTSVIVAFLYADCVLTAKQIQSEKDEDHLQNNNIIGIDIYNSFLQKRIV